jgi:hypothetical protein
MNTITATVLLSQDFRETCMGWNPDVEYREVATLEVPTTGDPVRDCDVVYAICNSYPDEMFCAAEFHPQVEAYRAGRNRSLSVGDLIRIGEATWAVGRFGFELAIQSGRTV